MSTKSDQSFRITLERPASVRRLLPAVAENGWMVPDFEVGEENAALKYLFDDTTLADLPSISPIVLYGEHGTGKTALSITLAVRWARLSHARPLCFSTGESFSADLASALEIDDMESFHSRYRKCKLLILDNLEPLANSPGAQDELVITLDKLADSRAPVIVTSVKLPATIRHLKPALASRLSEGYSIQLARPGRQSQMTLIAALTQEIDPQLPFEKIAEFCQGLSSPRAADLKAIVTIAHQAKNRDGSVDFDVLTQLVRQHLAGKDLSVADIAKVVARRMRVKLSDMRGSTRHAKIVRARGLAILLARKLTTASLQQIGHYFGDRDHSTILHAARKTDSLISSDAELSRAMGDVQAELVSR